MTLQQKHLGYPAVLALAASNVGLWLLLPPGAVAGGSRYSSHVIGEMFGTTAMVLMACALVLATRARFLEPLFGGLDRMYKAHRYTAIAAMVVLLLHVTTVSGGEKVRGSQLADPLGSIGLMGFLGLAAFSLVPRFVPVLAMAYERWRVLHKLNGVLFVISLVHALLVKSAMSTSPVLQDYCLAVSFLGIGAYLYQLVFARYLRKTYPYVVEGIRMLNASTVEIALMPTRRQLGFEAGQFLYVSFQGEGAARESHPFTISSPPGERLVRLAIKASGDYTRQIGHLLRPGTRATLEGGYGRFNYKRGRNRQVWIAGGIGITPFLSWIRAIDGTLQQEVDFFYAVHGPEEALYLDEISALAEQQPRLTLHTWYSGQAGHLTADGIVAACATSSIGDRDIYLCGSPSLVGALSGQLHALGIGQSQIHFEEFGFR